MLLGYVSDEYYLAISDAQVELRRPGWATVVRSGPSGAVYAGVEPGQYEVILARQGYGSKRIRSVNLGTGEPHHFRLLSDRLLGYAWPPWCKSGSPVEFRVHSVEPFKLGLWRYGYEKTFIRNVGWYDDHGPRAMMQTLPDGHFVETGVKWFGGNMKVHRQIIDAPERTGLYYFHAKGESGAFFSFPLVVAPVAQAKPQAKVVILASTNNWNAYNPFGGRSNYIMAARMIDEPIVNSKLDLPRYKVSDYWSEEMYRSVKRWVFERGGKLMYLGGNGLNCKVELSDDGKTMRCLNPWPAGKESRFHAQVESEANLLGVVYSDPGAMTSAP